LFPDQGNIWDWPSSIVMQTEKAIFVSSSTPPWLSVMFQCPNSTWSWWRWRKVRCCLMCNTCFHFVQAGLNKRIFSRKGKIFSCCCWCLEESLLRIVWRVHLNNKQSMYFFFKVADDVKAIRKRKSTGLDIIRIRNKRNCH